METAWLPELKRQGRESMETEGAQVHSPEHQKSQSYTEKLKHPPQIFGKVLISMCT